MGRGGGDGTPVIRPIFGSIERAPPPERPPVATSCRPVQAAADDTGVLRLEVLLFSEQLDAELSGHLRRAAPRLGVIARYERLAVVAEAPATLRALRRAIEEHQLAPSSCRGRRRRARRSARRVSSSASRSFGVFRSRVSPRPLHFALSACAGRR